MASQSTSSGSAVRERAPIESSRHVMSTSLAGALLIAGLLSSVTGCAGAPDAKRNEKKAVAQQPADPAGGTSAVPAAAQNADELIRDLELEGQARLAAAEQAVLTAKRQMDELDYQSAENSLREAVRLDPGNEEARKLLNEVLFLLGDRAGSIPNFLRSEQERQRVRMEQAVFELRRMLQEAEQSKIEEEYDDAIRIYDRILQQVQAGFPYPIDVSDIESQAKSGRDDARRLAKDNASRERSEQEKAAKGEADRERKESLRFVENRIRELMKQARKAYREKRYGDCVYILDEVIELDTTHYQAKALRKDAADLDLLATQMRTSLRQQQEWERSHLRQLETEIPYNAIFNFPDRDHWDQLSARTVSLSTRIQASESAAERDIKRALETLVTVDFAEGTTFQEVIDFLRNVSGINFVLTKETLDQATSPVKAQTVKDLPVRNVLNYVLGSHEPKLSYVIRQGAIVIGPSDQLRSDLYLEFYEINDITRDPPNFPAPKLALEGDSGESGGTGGGTQIIIESDTESTKTTIPVEALITLLKKSLWGEGEPEGESVEFQNGKLVVRTTLENHKKVAHLLDALRKSTGLMVTVESRFVNLQDNFLESVGITWGNPFGTNLPNPINDIDGQGTQMFPGFEAVNEQGDFDARIAAYNAYSVPLGSSVAPFNLSDQGGIAVQYNVLDDYVLEAVLEAVAKTQRSSNLDAPRVTAFNTQVSHSLVIDQEAYIKDAEVNQTGVVPVLNPVIGILNSGSILQVKPTVSYDRKYINLEIEPTLATQLPSRFKRLILGFTNLNVEFPVLSVTQIKTTVTIPDGGTVLVGGLNRSITSEQEVGIPVINQLPGMDILFGRKGETRLMSTLYVLMNAKITIIREEETKQFN